MSFIESLAKGFVRSAVNQVGRDGGKIISNRIYKDKHSTPIRIIGDNASNNENYTSSNSINSRDDIRRNGYKVEFFGSGILFYVALLVLGLLFPIVGPVVIVVYSLKNILRKYTKFYTVNQETVYVRDRRYKTGVRPEGYRNVKERLDIVAIPTKLEKTIYITKGVVGLAISICFSIFHYQIYQSVEATKAPTDKIVVVNSERGMQIRNDSTEVAGVVKVVPLNDTLVIVSSESDLTENWTKVRYKNIEGWVSSGSLSNNDLLKN